MRFKVDQNLPMDLAERLTAAGHDAVTTYQQGLSDADDRVILEVCKSEGRALITLDLDFSDIRSYPPEATPGIILLRPHAPTKAASLALLDQLLAALASRPIGGTLWVVEEKGIRVRSGRRSGN